MPVMRIRILIGMTVMRIIILVRKTDMNPYRHDRRADSQCLFHQYALGHGFRTHQNTGNTLSVGAKFWKGQGANYQYEGTSHAILWYKGISSELFLFKRASV